MARKVKLDPEQGAPQIGNDDREWVGVAWAAWLQGERNYTALARQFGKHRDTVKRHLEAYSKARAGELGTIDAAAEYRDGLEADLREALRTYRSAENPNAKVGALKHATAIRELIAAVSGVVTKREGRELTGSNGAAIQVESEVAHDVRPNGNLMQLLATMRDLAPLIPPVGGCADAEVDEVPAAPTEPEADSVPTATAP
jgi:hypothetical protein